MNAGTTSEPSHQKTRKSVTPADGAAAAESAWKAEIHFQSLQRQPTPIVNVRKINQCGERSARFRNCIGEPYDFETFDLAKLSKAVALRLRV